MTTSTVEARYTLKRIEEMLGLSRTVVAGLISAGFVMPTRGPGRTRRFSFQDLMLLRTAYELQQASIPPRKILQSLSKLRAELPEELPLTGLRITAVGADVAVRDRSGSWRADSGQLLMDFEVADVAGTVSFLQGHDKGGPSAEGCFAKGAALEMSDPAAAEEAYREAIALDPTFSHAYLNLGALYCETSRAHEAVTLYDEAFKRVKPEPRLYFNLGIALEEEGRPGDAQAAYEEALALDPGFADAHYNVGVLLENAGDPRGALRHFSAYRRIGQGA